MIRIRLVHVIFTVVLVTFSIGAGVRARAGLLITSAPGSIDAAYS